MFCGLFFIVDFDGKSCRSSDRAFNCKNSLPLLYSFIVRPVSCSIVVHGNLCTRSCTSRQICSKQIPSKLL